MDWLPSGAEILDDSLTDEMMNLFEIAVKLPNDKIIAITFLNKYCYLPDIGGDSKVLKLSV